MQANVHDKRMPDTDNDGQDRLLISAKHFARLLDVSVRTLWRLRSAGKLPESIRIGGSVRWNAQQVNEWIEEGCPAFD